MQAPFANDDTIPFGEEDQIQSGKLPWVQIILVIFF